MAKKPTYEELEQEIRKLEQEAEKHKGSGDRSKGFGCWWELTLLNPDGGRCNEVFK